MVWLTEETYVVERYAAIILRISVSDAVVSSNPGVSTNVTHRPESLNLFPVSILDVQDLDPCATGKLDPLTRLMN